MKFDAYLIKLSKIFPGNAFKMSSSSWASKRQSRENWAEEVIAAAMKTGSEEGKKNLQVTYLLMPPINR